MSTADPLLVETLTRMLEEHCTPEVVDRAERGEWPKELWDTLEAAGLPLAWVPETRGGAGASLADGFGIVRVAARYAAPVPLAETLLAGWTLSQAGVDAPPGPLSAAPTRTDDAPALNSRGRLSGVLRGVPFASDARALVLVARRGDGVAMAMLKLDADRHRDRVGRGSSLAGEPQDDVSLDDLIPDVITNLPAGFDLAQRRVGATLRAQQIAGALEAALEQSLRYAGDRSQFGRPIAKFQSVQHNLAVLAGEAAAAGAAADAAASAIARFGAGDDRAFRAVAAAKIRAGEAAGSGAAIAHNADFFDSLRIPASPRVAAGPCPPKARNRSGRTSTRPRSACCSFEHAVPISSKACEPDILPETVPPRVPVVTPAPLGGRNMGPPGGRRNRPLEPSVRSRRM